MTAYILALAAISSFSTLLIRAIISRHPFRITEFRSQIQLSIFIGVLIWLMSSFFIHLAASASKVVWQDFMWGSAIFAGVLLLIFYNPTIAGTSAHYQRQSRQQQLILPKAWLYISSSQDYAPFTYLTSKLKEFIDVISASPWISITFAAGIVLRMAGFTAGAIWYDEMFSLQMTHQGLFEMIDSLTLNISPPGFEILLWIITRVFGWNTFSLRLISVMASILILWVVYKITSSLEFNQRQKIVTLAVIGMLPYQLIAAQQGRVYSLFALLYLIGLYAAINGRWVWLGVSIGGMLWCHNIAILFIPGLLLISLLIFPTELKRIIGAALAGFISFLPWIKFFFQQTTLATPWFRPLSLGGFAYNFYVSFFGWNFLDEFKVFGFLWTVLLSLTSVFLMLLAWLRERRKANITSRFYYANKSASTSISGAETLEQTTVPHRVMILLAIASMLPLGLMIVASLLYKNIIIYRTMSVFMVPFLIWLVYIYVPTCPARLHKIIWAITLIFAGIAFTNWTPTTQGGDMDAFKNLVDRNFGPADAFYHNTGFSAIVFKYYFPDKNHYIFDAQNMLGATDLVETKIDIERYEPSQVPARRLWVVWTHHEELIAVNPDADRQARKLVTHCPLVAVIHYPQSWDNDIYLCQNHRQ